MTREEREKLHEVLFSRALREAGEGSMKEALIAVDLLDRLETGKDTASEVLAALLGDNRVPDEA